MLSAMYQTGICTENFLAKNPIESWSLPLKKKLIDADWQIYADIESWIL